MRRNTVIATKEYIQKLREKSGFNISKEQEKLILEKLGKEPEPEEYTEQDIFEQIRKIIRN